MHRSNNGLAANDLVDPDFGRMPSKCDCSLGLVECQCVQACGKAELDDLPLTRSDWTLATVIVACCAIPIVLGPMALAFFARVFS